VAAHGNVFPAVHPIFVIIAVVVGVRYHLCWHRNQLRQRPLSAGRRRAGAHLRKTLRRRWPRPIAAARHRAVHRTAAEPDLSAARLDYAGGHLEALRSQPAVPDYPAGSPVSAPLRRSTAPSISATPRWLSFEPTLPLMQVWRNVYQQAVISLVNITIIYTLLGIIIFANKRMLRRLAEATNRFQDGDHEVRLPVSGTLEGRMLASPSTTWRSACRRWCTSCSKARTT
jgi:hypothetical protein